jgi:hypothetical protein
MACVDNFARARSMPLRNSPSTSTPRIRRRRSTLLGSDIGSPCAPLRSSEMMLVSIRQFTARHSGQKSRSGLRSMPSRGAAASSALRPLGETEALSEQGAGGGFASRIIERPSNAADQRSVILADVNFDADGAAPFHAPAVGNERLGLVCGHWRDF